MVGKNRLIILVLLATSIIFVGLYINEKLSLPISFKVCGLGYVDCQIVARFDNREDCETTQKKWGWYCNEFDKNNIVCKEKTSDIATGFCD